MGEPSAPSAHSLAFPLLIAISHTGRDPEELHWRMPRRPARSTRSLSWSPFHLAVDFLLNCCYFTKIEKKRIISATRETTLLCILLNHAQILKIAVVKILSIFHIIFQNFMSILKFFRISERVNNFLENFSDFLNANWNTFQSIKKVYSSSRIFLRLSQYFCE